MKRFLTDAISEKLDSESGRGHKKPWMSHFGALADHAEAVRRVDRVIESEFEQVDPSDWR